MPSGCNAKVIIEGFQVRNMEFPNENQLDKFDLFMVTGSRRNFFPWIKPWINFLPSALLPPSDV